MYNDIDRWIDAAHRALELGNMNTVNVLTMRVATRSIACGDEQVLDHARAELLAFNRRMAVKLSVRV